ncbi:undecaprenyl-diphosphate phosphatase [Seongchinamella sediminis]|uniref:Undecaprenyl-diphosphatase n=1 Tax=Seongchinamella sediminis TaxID=2283635 RepID=A0A3L7DZZ3_9GAMM|nr:undecaprenyl-diphosphate phosphatase [Seongchinamella sediminis]RLQ21571.1 undecaprenyl-diphosphate phosphatase [Seongchinamella sediminis]
MDLFQALVLAVLQGLTEFLPISSSAHLVFPSLLLAWPDQGLAFDVAVHLGTLLAVVWYYHRDLWQIAMAWGRSVSGGAATADSRMVWYLLSATVPAALLGLLLGDAIEAHARNLPVIASTTLVFGLLLGFADRHAQHTPGDRRLSFGVALFVGLAQAVALIPGVSRSGVTITAGLLLNMSRQDAARFSFLLSIPVISGAALVKSVELLHSPAPVNWLQLGIAAGASALTAYLCIAIFLRLLDRVGMMPFVYYRIVLAVILFAVWLA